MKIFNFIERILTKSFNYHIDDFERDLLKIYEVKFNLSLPDSCFRDYYIESKEHLINDLIIGLDKNFLDTIKEEVSKEYAESNIFKLAELLEDDVISIENKDRLKTLSVNEGIKIAEHFYNKYDQVTVSNEGYLSDLIFETINKKLVEAI